MVSVETARVWEHPNLRCSNTLGLKTIDGFRLTKRTPKGCDPENGYEPGLELEQLSSKQLQELIALLA